MDVTNVNIDIGCVFKNGTGNKWKECRQSTTYFFSKCLADAPEHFGFYTRGIFESHARRKNELVLLPGRRLWRLRHRLEEVSNSHLVTVPSGID